MDKRHGSRSNDPHPVTERGLAALPEIVAAPGAVSLAPDGGTGLSRFQHVRFLNGWWYYYTEEVRNGKKGMKGLVLVTLRKSPGKKVASDQASSAGAGSLTSKTILAEAKGRLRRSNSDFKHNREEKASVLSEENNEDDSYEVFLDEGLVIARASSETGADSGMATEAVTATGERGGSGAGNGADLVDTTESSAAPSTSMTDGLDELSGAYDEGRSFSVSPLRGDPVRRRNWKLQLNKLETNSLDVSKPLDVGETPDVLVVTGAEQLPLVMDADVVAKAKNKHGLSVGQLRDIFDHLHAPTAVFQSAKIPDGMVVLTSMVHNGEPLIAAIHLDKVQQRHVVNKIESIYAKDTAGIRRWLDEGSLVYLDRERSPLLAQSIGLHLPKEATLQRGRIKVLTEADVVKRSNPDAAEAPHSKGGTHSSNSIVPDGNQSLVDDQQTKKDTSK